jgi:5-methyltetrahydrofolate--homocysteine methyltransferase
MLSSIQNVKRPECGTIDLDDMDFESMVEAYMEQVRGLVDGGVDILLVETVYDALNAKAALCAISKVELEKGIGVPVMVSATIDAENGSILSGETLEELFASLSGYDILSFGLNCSFGVAGVMPFVEQLANSVLGGKGIPCFLSICPNAGLPDANGQYGELPDFTAYHIKAMAQKGLINIAGGCCGTTPEHIKAIKKALEGMAPRRVLSM